MVRCHRRWYQKLFYVHLYRCRECGIETPMRREFSLKPSAYVQCPRCHTHKVTRRIAPDKIDRVIHTFSSVMQGMLGGRLYHCVYCRIQFYDLRHSVKNAPGKNASVSKDAPTKEDTHTAEPDAVSETARIAR
jgi:DNA-directed RNA polymerase subunit RPC12/RpoP